MSDRYTPSATADPNGAFPFTPVSVRERHDGWTVRRQQDFIAALAASGCVHEACAAVRMSRESAYALRARPDAKSFRIAWDAALDYAVRRLTDECFSRALKGEVIPHYYKGEIVGEHRRYDNRLAMWLMRYRDPLRYAVARDQFNYGGAPEDAAEALGQASANLAKDRWDAEASPPCRPHTPLPLRSPNGRMLPVQRSEEEIMADFLQRLEMVEAEARMASGEGDAPLDGASTLSTSAPARAPEDPDRDWLWQDDDAPPGE